MTTDPSTSRPGKWRNPTDVFLLLQHLGTSVFTHKYLNASCCATKPSHLFPSLRLVMTRLVALLTLQALAVWPVAFGAEEDPPNHANSTVPYTVPSSAKYNYAEVIHKVSISRIPTAPTTHPPSELALLSRSTVRKTRTQSPSGMARRLVHQLYRSQRRGSHWRLL